MELLDSEIYSLKEDKKEIGLEEETVRKEIWDAKEIMDIIGKMGNLKKTNSNRLFLRILIISKSYSCEANKYK